MEVGREAKAAVDMMRYGKEGGSRREIRGQNMKSCRQLENKPCSQSTEK